MTTAALVHKRATVWRWGSDTVYAMRFQFATGDGCIHLAHAWTTTPHLLEDEPAELVLYDPAKPARAWMLDEVPPHSPIDAAGHLAEVPHMSRRAVIPVIVIGYNIFKILSFVV